MKKILYFCLTALKWPWRSSAYCWSTASNYLIYGHHWEGDRVHYDSYAMFLNDEGIRPMVHNPDTTGRPGSRTIWLFGGSTMRGDGADAETNIPSYLAGLLNSRPALLLAPWLTLERTVSTP